MLSGNRMQGSGSFSSAGRPAIGEAIMSFDFLILYSITIFLASIIPGPSMLLALTHGMHYGAKRTIVSALGNVAVTFVQALISIAGLGSVLLASESFFQIIKLLGAGYLIYIGISLLYSSKLFFIKEARQHAESDSFKKMFLNSALVTAGNPKAILFFTAVFPQFINTSSDCSAQFSVLIILCLFIAFICFMVYAICGQKIMAVFFNHSSARYIKHIIGCTFIGAGIGLAFSKK